MKNPWTEFIDLKKYPVDDLQNPLRAKLVGEFKSSIERMGVAEIEDFLTPAGIERMARESSAIEAKAFHNALVGNAYLDDPDPTLPADHTRKMTEKTALGALAYDQIPPDHLIRQIYEWDALMHFIADILALEKIYRYGDPMGALNIAVMKDGDYLRWHFDQTDFVTSLSIRNADEGGYFEYAPMIRTPNLENYHAVKSVIQGARDMVQLVENKPGTLVLFKGRHSLHRVTPIKGKTSRLMGLFGYDTKPNTQSSDYLRRIRYGRTK